MISFKLLFISCIVLSSAQEKESRILTELSSHKEIIISAAKTVGISPRIVASIIYAEHRLNYNWEDAVLDNVLANSGYNSSVGFGQIKLNTAFWIEEELHNPSGSYYLGKNIERLFSRSRTRTELVEKLIKDSSNIYYTAVYIAMIKQRWSKSYLFQSEIEAGMLATIYSLGVTLSNGNERLPHSNPKMNDFGRTAQSFFDSFQLFEIGK